MTTARLWLHTGDLAYIDEDGYVFLVDRKKDMLKTSGFQVWPREIEEVISAHPAVLEVGVAGIPDAVKGEVAKAWIVLKRDVTRRQRRTRSERTVASGWRRTRCRPTSSSVQSCRRRWSEKFCGACSSRRPSDLTDAARSAHRENAHAGVDQRLHECAMRASPRRACRRARRSFRPRARRAIHRSH